jgi:hypothetical protein
MFIARKHSNTVAPLRLGRTLAVSLRLAEPSCILIEAVPQDGTV